MIAEAQRQTQAKQAARVRRPFANKDPNLPLPVIKGHVPRWFNDEENRLPRAQDAGWEFVAPDEFPSFRASSQVAPNSDLGSRISVVCGTDEQGKSVRAYLMKIKKEWYDEDASTKMASINETDRAIHGGRLHPHVGSYIKQVSVTT